jgi:hypothetical protein
MLPYLTSRKNDHNGYFLSVSFEIAKIMDNSTLLIFSKAVFDLLLSYVKTPVFESDNESDYADYNTFSKINLLTMIFISLNIRNSCVWISIIGSNMNPIKGNGK